MPASKDGVLDAVYFMLMRFNLHNRGPSHPANYEQILLGSELFEEKMRSKIIRVPKDNEVVNISKLQNMYFNLIATCCYNDPTQIPKLIDNGLLSQICDLLKIFFPVHQAT